MIKFVAAAIWVSLLTTGAVLFSFQSLQPEAEAAEEEPGAFGGIDYVSSDIISVPVVQQGEVVGYFLSRLVYTAESKKLAQLKLPAAALISDEVYTYLYANPELDFTQLDTIDLDLFRNGIRERVNERVGEALIREVLIEQMDYLRKHETQATTIRRAS